MSTHNMDIESKPPTTETSSYSGASDITEQPVGPHDPSDDPDRNEAEWMDRGHMHDIESQRSRVCCLPYLY